MKQMFFHSLSDKEYDFSDCIARHSGDETIVYKTVGGEPIHLSLYYPPNYDSAKKYPVFVFIHGGGWSTHKIFPDQKEWAGDYLGFLARYYADKGYVSVSIDYRLMRENGQAEGYGLVDLYEDCESALDYLQDHVDTYGLDFSNAVLLGESAGGYLAGALATLFDGVNSIFSRVILVNPITNLLDSRWKRCSPQTSKCMMLKRKSSVEIACQLSPAWQISNKTPRTLLIHGMDDTTVHPQHSQCFYDEMRLHENEVELHWIEDTTHAFLLAEYVIGKKETLKAASLAVDVIDKWLSQGEENNE